MAKQVIWNKRAIKKLEEIINYLEIKASPKAAINLASKVFESIEILSRYPERGRKSKRRKTIRLINIGKHHHLYYRIHGKKLIIINFFDLRQEPSKNPYN